MWRRCQQRSTYNLYRYDQPVIFFPRITTTSYLSWKPQHLTLVFGGVLPLLLLWVKHLSFNVLYFVHFYVTYHVNRQRQWFNSSGGFCSLCKALINGIWCHTSKWRVCVLLLHLVCVECVYLKKKKVFHMSAAIHLCRIHTFFYWSPRELSCIYHLSISKFLSNRNIVLPCSCLLLFSNPVIEMETFF